MPSVSRSQRRLFGAAEHGASFPLAQRLRATMTHQQLHDFARTKETGLPPHVPHPHRNLGKFLHPRKTGLPGLAGQMSAMRVQGAFGKGR